jgi:2,4-diaminopentanoate dehydrogenase
VSGPASNGGCRVVHMGLGPIGLEIARLVGTRRRLRSVAAVDVQDDILGRRLSEVLDSPLVDDPEVVGTVDEAARAGADVVLHATGSSLRRCEDQLTQCLAAGLHVVSTCEELSYPWTSAPEIASRLNAAAERAEVCLVGTGVNPGFAMDYLPVVLTGTARRVDHVRVARTQDAGVRRVPLQRKVGAGLSMEEFRSLAADGVIRHVGLRESAQAVGSALGWRLDRVEETIAPVLAERAVASALGPIEAGGVAGVGQVAVAYEGEREVVRLELRMAVGLESRDEVWLTGDPDVHAVIPSGLHGDVATAAMVVNVVEPLLRAAPGLRVMSELAPPRPGH